MLPESTRGVIVYPSSFLYR